MATDNTRFPMPTAPKNGLDLLRCLIFEPILLDRFSKKLTEERRLWFLRAYSWIVVVSSVLYLIVVLTVVGFALHKR